VLTIEEDVDLSRCLDTSVLHGSAFTRRLMRESRGSSSVWRLSVTVSDSGCPQIAGVKYGSHRPPACETYYTWSANATGLARWRHRRRHATRRLPKVSLLSTMHAIVHFLCRLLHCSRLLLKLTHRYNRAHCSRLCSLLKYLVKVWNLGRRNHEIIWSLLNLCGLPTFYAYMTAPRLSK